MKWDEAGATWTLADGVVAWEIQDGKSGNTMPDQWRSPDATPHNALGLTDKQIAVIERTIAALEVEGS